jgi:hypothetical protein
MAIYVSQYSLGSIFNCVYFQWTPVMVIIQYSNSVEQTVKETLKADFFKSLLKIVKSIGKLFFNSKFKNLSKSLKNKFILIEKKSHKKSYSLFKLKFNLIINTNFPYIKLSFFFHFKFIWLKIEFKATSIDNWVLFKIYGIINFYRYFVIFFFFSMKSNFRMNNLFPIYGFWIGNWGILTLWNL